MTVTSAEIMRALEGVYDPELGLSVIALGLVYGVDVADGAVRITITLTAADCPIHGRTLLARRYAPGGLRGDGPTFGYEELAVEPGRHLLEVTLAEGRAEGGEPGKARRWTLREEVEITRGRAQLVEFTEDAGFRWGGR